MGQALSTSPPEQGGADIGADTSPIRASARCPSPGGGGSGWQPTSLRSWASRYRAAAAGSWCPPRDGVSVTQATGGGGRPDPASAALPTVAYPCRMDHLASHAYPLPEA